MPIMGLEVIDLNICGTSSGHKTIILGSSSHRITHIILVFIVRDQHTHTIWKYQKYWRIFFISDSYLCCFQQAPLFNVLGIKLRTLYLIVNHSFTELSPQPLVNMCVHAGVPPRAHVRVDVRGQ